MNSYAKREVVNKSHLVEPIVRQRIQDSLFYKEHLHLTNEATIVPVIVEHVHSVGGTNSIGKPSPFLCCLLRMLEIEPNEEVVQTYLDQMGYNEFKYLTALSMLYVRLVFESPKVYEVLDPYYADSRKIRYQLKNPRLVDNSMAFYDEIKHIDEWADSLVEEKRVVDIILPRLVPRQTLVERELVKPRTYFVDLGDEAESEDDYESDSD